MRKRVLTKQVAVMLSVEMYQKIIESTDRAEISISQFIREIIEEKINRNKGDNSNEQ
jgi:predicted DNA-binding protein